MRPEDIVDYYKNHMKPTGEHRLNEDFEHTIAKLNESKKKGNRLICLVELIQPENEAFIPWKHWKVNVIKAATVEKG